MPQSPEQEEVSQFVTAVFQDWKRAGIPFLVLRNYENLPHSTSNDIDVLVEPASVRAAEECLVAAARGANFRLHNRAEFATLACYFSSNYSNAQVHFDLFTDLKWRSFDFLRCEEFLGRRIECGLFSIPHPADEAATNLLANLIYTGKVKEKYKATITAGFRDEGAAATKLIAQTYGSRLAKEIVGAGAKENWPQIEAASSNFRRAMIAHQITREPLARMFSFFREGARVMRRMLRPPGLTVVLCGPDGSGKSTVGRALIEGLKPTFSPLKGRQFHWKPAVFSGGRMAARTPTVTPHAKPPRGIALSILYFGFHLLEFIVGSRACVVPATFRGGLILIDRYYYDFFVDQCRYRLKVPQFLVRLGYHFLRKPELILLLDAPAEVLQSRKQEVSLVETQRQRDDYLSLIKRFPNGRVINGAQPAEKVVSDCIKVILDFMAERTSRRR